jgi:hypothetical protein
MTSAVLGDAVEDSDRDRRRACGSLGPAAKTLLGLDGHNALDGRRIVVKVRPVACTDLDHMALETVEELTTVLVLAPTPRRGCDESLSQASEVWVVRLLLGHRLFPSY